MNPEAILPAFLAGLAFGAVSLVSIGPNNIRRLREGFGGCRPGLVSGVMWLSNIGLVWIVAELGRRTN